MNPTDPQNETLAKLTELLRAANVNLNPQPPAPGAWPPPQPSFAPPANFAPPVQPCGLLVPVTIQTSAGEVSTYIQLPQTAVANPQAAIESLARAGWPIRIYTRRENGGGNGYGNGGSYGGNGYQQRSPARWGRRQW